jgi:hypothetical protein
MTGLLATVLIELNAAIFSHKSGNSNCKLQRADLYWAGLAPLCVGVLIHAKTRR